MAEKKTLVDEVIENARRDRKRLEAVADGLTHGFDSKDDSEELDPEVSAAFAEEIAKISDSLTKVNQQLVELIKVDAKKNPPADAAKPEKLSKQDKEDLYDELSDGSPLDKELN
jgi:hypothetical protein